MDVMEIYSAVENMEYSDDEVRLCSACDLL